MKSGSYSSYRAALPIEALDGPDDEPLPGVEYWRSRDTPGTFDVWIRSGWGRSEGRTRRIRNGLSLEEATIIAKDLDARYQDRLAERYGAEADAEDARDARLAAEIAANDAAMDAVEYQ